MFLGKLADVILFKEGPICGNHLQNMTETGLQEAFLSMRGRQYLA